MRALRLAAALLLTVSVLAPTPSSANERGRVERFARLPAGKAHPEGIALAADGRVYVTLFQTTAPADAPGEIFVFDAGGQLEREIRVEGSSPLLLDLAFHPTTGELLVVDFGGDRVLRVDPLSGQSSVFAAAAPEAGLNALSFDAQGNVYVSDSFQGTVWKIAATGGEPTAFVASPLLVTAGTPPFGANGLDFNHDESALFVANTGDDRVIRVPVTDGVAGQPEIFVNSVNGADGLFVDEHDNLWVAANQSDELVVLDPSGRLIARLGDFRGLDASGAPIGFLLPASAVRRGPWVYVTNLALDIRELGLPQAVDSQVAADVRIHTIARIRVPRALR